MHGSVTNNAVKFTIRATPLPDVIKEFLRDNLALLRRMELEQKTDKLGSGDEEAADLEEEFDKLGELLKKPSVKPEEFWTTLAAKFKETGGEWTDVVNQIWAFGPQRAGTCILVDSRAHGALNS